MNQFIDKLFTFSLIFFDSDAGERIGLHIGFRNEMWNKYEKEEEDMVSGFILLTLSHSDYWFGLATRGEHGQQQHHC